MRDSWIIAMFGLVVLHMVATYARFAQIERRIRQHEQEKKDA